MTRRELLSAGAAASLEGAQAKRRPNLIYVFADQLRYQSCGYAGDEYAATPHIDRLASQSVSVRQAISNTPVCAPYRASLMTGKCQSSTGMVINELRLSPDQECIGHTLTRGGYKTGYIGKWHLWANQLGGHGRTVNGFVPPGPYRLGFDGLWAGYNFSHVYYKAPYFQDRPEREIWKGYEPDSQTAMAIDFLKQAKGGADPFALFLSWGPPHDPWDWGNVPPEQAERFREKQIPDRPNYREQRDPYADNWGRPPDDYFANVQQYKRAYYGQTANIDDNVGRLMKALDDLGLAEDTILVFTSDHGEMFGSQGRRAKLIFYEEAIRVPFLVRWPGRIRAGSVTDALLGTTDIFPTLVSMLGLRVPSSAEGEDLSGVLQGRGRGPQAQYLQGMGTTAAWRDGHEWRAMRDEQFTYATYRRDGSELLFDNRADPYQMKNLAGERRHMAKLEDSRRRLRAWMRERNDAFEPCTWYEKQWTRDRNIIRGARGGSHDLGRLERLLAEMYPGGIPA